MYAFATLKLEAVSDTLLSRACIGVDVVEVSDYNLGRGGELEREESVRSMRHGGLWPGQTSQNVP